MLVVSPKLDKYEVAAGEPWIMSVVFRDAQNNLLDMAGRRMVLSFYRNSGRGLFAKIDGVAAGLGILQFVRPGTFTESLFGEGLTISLSERLLSGRETLATGKLTVNASADPVETYGSLIGRAESRATVYLDERGIVTKWGDLLPLVYANDGAPVILTPAAISSDGTPQIGETFIGIDATGNGPIVARRWIDSTGTTADVQTYVGKVAGSLRFETDLQGPNGIVVTSSSTINVTSPANINNTLASSTLRSSQVEGEPAIYAANYPDVSALKARIVAVRNRRLALIPRITALEGGTPGAVTLPPATTDPAYGAGDQVVVNATRFSGFLDDTFAAASTEAGALATTRSRINALKGPSANTLTYQGQVLTRQGQPLTYGATA